MSRVYYGVLWRAGTRVESHIDDPLDGVKSSHGTGRGWRVLIILRTDGQLEIPEMEIEFSLQFLKMDIRVYIG